jgi:ABC-2 type transport system ATP-binding protein
VIEITNLTRMFGKHAALDDVSLYMPQGSVYALVGPAGAGKSTLLKILATLLPPTSGDATVAGSSVSRDKARARQLVGYLPQDFGVYGDQTCAEYIAFFAACYGVPRNETGALANDLLQLVDLYHRKDMPADQLTRSMKQRLGLARVLAHDPQVLLLDQPTTNLDPRARVELRELIRELGGMNKTIVMTAAHLAELQDVCTHVAVLQDGKLDRAGTMEEMGAGALPYRVLSVRFLGDPDLAATLIKQGHGVVEVQQVTDPATAGSPALAGVTVLKEIHVTFDGEYGDASNLLKSLMHSGVQVVSFAEEA